MTQESDFDYLVLATELPDDPEKARALREQADGLRRTIAISEGAAEMRAPGASGVFGRVVGAFDLIEQIGLQNDTNHSLTRRMLLLEESVSLGNSAVHEKVVRAALDRYLTVIDAPSERTPRFLLNDVIRYWRTITVDYQAKALDGGAAASGLRYLKLIIPRKILFAGTLMALLHCREEEQLGTVDHLFEQFMMPPLARLVAVQEDAPDRVRDALARVLVIANHFIERSGDASWREEVEQGDRNMSEPSAFAEMREQARELQRCLEAVFFDWPKLADKSRHYLAF